MLFNSLDFALFLPVVFVLYWFVVNKKLQLQNLFIVIASYFFYGCWDYRFLSLLITSTTVDYFIGIALYKEKKDTKRNFLLLVSIVINLGILFVFKYYNFFIDNFIEAFSFIGFEVRKSSLNIVLPVGISFYTFQTLGYSIDVYKKKIKPTFNFVAFAAYVSFFPQLVAGPIERAKDLLPQFYLKRVFTYEKAVDGMRQILWGFLKKIVIADGCAQYVDIIFSDPTKHTGSTLIFCLYLFTCQIYCDFSGYSSIAIGTARLFGFNLKKNFAFPLFSRDFSEFWRRWHISLTTWFKDYFFIPLLNIGKSNIFSKVVKLFLYFIVIGLWHGASWSFVLWGIVNALFCVPSLFFKKKYKTETIAQGKYFPSLKEFFQLIRTSFFIVSMSLFFRVENVGQLTSYIGSVFSYPFFSIPRGVFGKVGAVFILITILFMIIEWLGRENEYAIEKIGLNWKRPYRWMFYATIIFVMGIFMATGKKFIYFDF